MSQALRYFPFTAIVGQERLVRALLLNAVNPAVGGVLIKGPSGTGKSTAVRGLAELLPEIAVVADCPFSCPTRRPVPVVPGRVAAGEELPVTRRRRRIVDLPLNATEDRVSGSVDVARALESGERALEPGLLAEANRGILYVDEINLLDDHLTDVLLDAAALGVNVVEREGVSVSHPARFLLVGTMNEEEGELRPQIADRIGLEVEVEALADPESRAEVVRRREAFAAEPGRRSGRSGLRRRPSWPSAVAAGEARLGVGSRPRSALRRRRAARGRLRRRAATGPTSRSSSARRRSPRWPAAIGSRPRTCSRRPSSRSATASRSIRSARRPGRAAACSAACSTTRSKSR